MGKVFGLMPDKTEVEKKNEPLGHERKLIYFGIIGLAVLLVLIKLGCSIGSKVSRAKSAKSVVKREEMFTSYYSITGAYRNLKEEKERDEYVKKAKKLLDKAVEFQKQYSIVKEEYVDENIKAVVDYLNSTINSMNKGI